MQHYLAACAIFRDEATYLREWIEFHLLAGVQHFYLYDNFSTDQFEQVLAPYQRQGVVTLTHWPADCRWIAFIDLDEFLFSPGQADLKSQLKEFEEQPAVVANWVNFGSAGHVTRPEDLVIANFTRRGPLDVRVSHQPLDKHGQPKGPPIQWQINRIVKSIVDPARTLHARNAHWFEYSRGKAVDENFGPVASSNTAAVSVRKLRINHYFSKSQEECRAKFARGRADVPVHRKWDEFLHRDTLLNSEEDRDILRFLELLRMRMGQL